MFLHSLVAASCAHCMLPAFLKYLSILSLPELTVVEVLVKCGEAAVYVCEQTEAYWFAEIHVPQSKATFLQRKKNSQSFAVPL